MSVEERAAKAFKMTDEVWVRHANPWSVWSRFTCLPLMGMAVWSRTWLGWWALLAVAIAVLWIWVNPRIFRKPRSTHSWASRGVLGERVWLNHPKDEIPDCHLKPVALYKLVSTLGFITFAIGLTILDPFLALIGMAATILGKLLFFNRMVVLYDELKGTREEYLSWLYRADD